MKTINNDSKLIDIIKNLYTKSNSVILRKEAIGEWFPATTGVRQGCLFSTTICNPFLEDIIYKALHSHNGTIKINRRINTDLRFADDIDGLAGSEEALVSLAMNISLAASTFGMCNIIYIIRHAHIISDKHFTCILAVKPIALTLIYNR